MVAFAGFESAVRGCLSTVWEWVLVRWSRIWCGEDGRSAVGAARRSYERKHTQENVSSHFSGESWLEWWSCNVGT